MIRKPFRKHVSNALMRRYPQHVQVVNDIYDKYYPRKKQFISNLKGNNRIEEAGVMKGLTPEDSKILMESLRKLLPVRKYIERRGRGHRQGLRKYQSTLPLRFAETVAIYIYKRR